MLICVGRHSSCVSHGEDHRDIMGNRVRLKISRLAKSPSYLQNLFGLP